MKDRNSAYGGSAVPPRPFQFRLAPQTFCPSVAWRGPSSRLSLSTLIASISRDRESLSSHPHGTTALVAEPGRGDAPCTTWTLAVFFHPPKLRRVSLCPVSPSDSSRSENRSRPSSDSDLSVGGFQSTGDLNYSRDGFVSKEKLAKLSTDIELPLDVKITSL